MYMYIDINYGVLNIRGGGGTRITSYYLLAPSNKCIIIDMLKYNKLECVCVINE